MIRIVSFDFEASALVDGFPVSIGVAKYDGAMYHALIRPTDEWVTTDYKWDPVAATMHGYSIERLRAEGLPPAQIIDELNELFPAEAFASDAPAADFAWLRTLVDAADAEARFDVRRVALDAIQTMLEDEVDMPGDARREISQLRGQMHTHNALSDAASWIAALEAVEAWSAEGKDLRASARVFQKWKEHVATYLAGQRVLTSYDAALRDLSKT